MRQSAVVTGLENCLIENRILGQEGNYFISCSTGELET